MKFFVSTRQYDNITDALENMAVGESCIRQDGVLMATQHWAEELPDETVYCTEEHCEW
jgi:hypothetical protein